VPRRAHRPAQHGASFWRYGSTIESDAVENVDLHGTCSPTRRGVASSAVAISRVLLVHGAGHGAWCWDRVLELLRSNGYRPEAWTFPAMAIHQSRSATSTAMRTQWRRASM
jgi:hypothetical protein